MEKQPLSSSCAEQKPLRVVVVGLASCFGCQLQITNQEHFLTDILGRIDLEYWQLASSEPMPEEFDIAIIEGAVDVYKRQELRRPTAAAPCVSSVNSTISLTDESTLISNVATQKFTKTYNIV